MFAFFSNLLVLNIVASCAAVFHILTGMDLYMTVPIVMEFHATQCIFCWSRFTMSFCLPSRYQDKPPKPTNKDVFLKKEAARIVYVR